jgi:hypothetical protein
VQPRRRLCADGAVGRHDAAENRRRIGLVRLDERLVDVTPDADAARVHVLDGDDGRLVELADDRQRGVGVVDVVVRQLLAVQLLRRRDVAGRRQRLAVERRPLVRVFAVAQVLHFLERQRQLLGQRLVQRAGEIIGDQRVVRRRVAERLGRQPLAGVRRRVAVCAHFFKHLAIVRGVGQHGDVRVVFRRRADHGRTADVDVFHRVFPGRVGSGDRLRERIQVDDHQVDVTQAEFLHLPPVLRFVAHRQKAGVHGRVQRLDAPVENFRKAGDVGNADDRLS